MSLPLSAVPINVFQDCWIAAEPLELSLKAGSFTVAQFIVANLESPIINLLPNAPGYAGQRVAAGASARPALQAA